MRALVTGCGRRLGFYLSEALKAEQWDVVGHYRTEHEGLDKLREQGIDLVKADFNDTDGVFSLIESIQKYDDFSLIIHNASAFTPQVTDLQKKHSSFQLFHIHMMAPYLINHALTTIK